MVLLLIYLAPINLRCRGKADGSCVSLVYRQALALSAPQTAHGQALAPKARRFRPRAFVVSGLRFHCVYFGVIAKQRCYPTVNSGNLPISDERRFRRLRRYTDLRKKGEGA